jgi:acetylornithine deacetylase/succinyl-diaminopimelate desuccinylase-like protein
MRFSILFACLLVTSALFADTNGAIAAYCRDNQKTILQEYLTLLRIPNEASDTVNIGKNTDWIENKMRNLGLKPRRLESKDPEAPAVLYGEWRTPGASRTLLLYAHYDGQPANADQWTITTPWQPVFRHPGDTKNMSLDELAFPVDPELRIYGRSSSDDKAGVMSILNAFDAVRHLKIPITSNLKFFFEGEEEAGSPHLDEVTAANRDLLRADLWLVIDGPTHPSGKKEVVFGVRGDVNVDITVYGPLRPLHSGHYGNWAPNPAMTLAKLLASMKDDSGRITIAGWYDDVQPLTARESQAVRESPNADEGLKKDLGIAQPDGSGKTLGELILEPSLNINGIRSADVRDRARNVIPTTAIATLDLRLVKGNDVQRQFHKLVDHIRKQGFFVIDREPSAEERQKHPKIATVILTAGGYNAQRTPMDIPISQFVTAAVQSTTGQPVVLLPSSGGSLPLAIIEHNLASPTISVPLANYDNNQHAENENLRLGNFWDGIATIAALLTH